MYQELDDVGHVFDFNAFDMDTTTNSTQWLDSSLETSTPPYILGFWDFAIDVDAATQTGQGLTEFPALDLTHISEYPFDAHVAPTSSSSSITSVPERGEAAFPMFNTDTLRWEALLSRSRLADSCFLYGVLSTKIYCRASCPSRRPIAANRVKYFTFPHAIENAEQLGFRACKRCMPQNLLATKSEEQEKEKGHKGVGRAVVAIWEQALRGKISTMELVAKDACLSMWHFHRQFKVVTGLTPAEYATACFALATQDALSTACDRRGQSDRQDRPKATFRDRRRQQQILGGLDVDEYSSGVVNEKLFSTTSDTAYGIVCVVWSFDSIANDRQETSNRPVRFHALLIGMNALTQMQIRFPLCCPSLDLQASVKAIAQDLDDLGRDRETEIPKKARIIVRRAKLWIELTRKWRTSPP